MNFTYHNTLTNHDDFISFDTVPSICPFCKKGVQFVPRGGIKNNKGFYFQVECPTCGFCCILHADEAYSRLINVTPSFLHIDLPKHIQELSPKFCKVYRQTLQAENFNLDELVGVGLSKAIEQLVYDYLVKVQNETPKTNFSQNIKMLKNFDDAVIQLSLARFIRNDEVHPEKQTNFSINDLLDASDCLITFFDAKFATFKLERKLKLNKTDDTV